MLHKFFIMFKDGIIDGDPSSNARFNQKVFLKKISYEILQNKKGIYEGNACNFRDVSVRPLLFPKPPFFNDFPWHNPRIFFRFSPSKFQLIGFLVFPGNKTKSCYHRNPFLEVKLD